MLHSFCPRRRPIPIPMSRRPQTKRMTPLTRPWSRPRCRINFQTITTQRRMTKNDRRTIRCGRLMTADDAPSAVTAINRHLHHARALLVDLYEQRGWVALGYTSWRACVLSNSPPARAPCIAR